jgi:hypothetical protein
MKSAVVALLVLGGVIASGCTDDSTSRSDPLGGVNDADASQLPDTSLRLACAEHDRSIFASTTTR